MLRRALLVSVLAALAVPAAAGAQTPTVDFKPCAGKFQCAKVKLPLDYGDPTGPTTTIKVTRLKARQPKRSLGPLFVNYGGPGADAVKTTQEFGRAYFGSFRKRFDLIAVDPRGTGGNSNTLDCKVNQEKLGVYAQPFLTPQNFDAEAEQAEARKFAGRCFAQSPKIAPHVSTANVARDFDAIRGALGYKKINYFGFSYGSFLGATYAAMFPDRIRAVVLDGALDPDSYINRPADGLAEQTTGFETALDRYFAACKRHKSYCKWLRGRSPRQAYDQIVARAKARPLKVKRPRLAGGDTRRVDNDDINWAVGGELYAEQLWPELTQALNRATKGDGSLFRAISNDSYGRRKNGTYKPDNDRYFALGAAEQQYDTDPQPYLDAGVVAFKTYPHFYFNTGGPEGKYAVYTARDEDAFLGPFTVPESAPPVLVVGTTFDPATTYDQAIGMTEALGNARLLTMRGDGHTAYAGQSACIDRNVDRYVIKLKLPRKGTKCRQEIPFPPPRGFAATASSSTATERPLIGKVGILR